MNKKIGQAFEKSKLGRNTTPKIISLVFAIVFWVYVMDQVNPEITKVYNDIPVEIVGVEHIGGDGLVLMSDEDYYVNITVEGRRNDLLSFEENLLVVTADIRGYQKGLNTVPIEKRVLVDNVSISDISRSDVKIELDKIVSISKPIKLVTIGELVNGLEVSDIEKDKIEVVVTGPENEVNKIDSLKGVINISEISHDFATEISLIPIDIDGNQVMNVELLEPSVNCSIGIDKSRTVSIIANFINAVPEGYQLINIHLVPKNVLIRGDVETVNNLRSLLTSEIDLSMFTEREKIDVDLNLPEGIEALNIEGPISADVVVEKIETKEFIFSLTEIAYTNLPENYEIQNIEDEGTIDVILKDISSKLDSVNRNDIELIVDLENVELGKQEMMIEIVTGVAIKNIELSRESLSLTITEEE
jgi:YbbR domain-containing protein